MNILILSWRGPGHPNAGGAEQSTHEHAKAWVRAGHNVTLFTSRHKDSEAEETIDGVNIVRRVYEVFGVQFAAFWWYLFGKHEKFDIVVDQFHGIPFFTPTYVRIPKLGFIHEVAKEVWSLNPWPRPFNLIPAFIGRIGEPWVFRLLYKNIPFMVVSESTKRDLVDWGIPDWNITVIHNGVTIPSTINHSPLTINRDKVAMYLGALSRDKGIEDALEAFSIINKQDKSLPAARLPDGQGRQGWKFWVVGKGDNSYCNNLEARCRELGIGRKTKFWGYVDERRKFELLAKAYVLINPSVREGWGLVNIEANAVGTPVVAYDVPGSRDSVRNGETGLLAEAGNPGSLASNVLKLLDAELYKGLQENALDWSKNFKWKRAGEKSLKLLEEVSNERNRKS